MTGKVLLIAFFFIAILYLAVYIFFSGKFLLWFLNRLGNGNFVISWKGGGAHFPWLQFRIHDFRILFPGEGNKDQIEIHIPKLSGRLSFWNLFLGKIVIRWLDLKNPKGYYINRQPSEEKMEHLPKRNLFLIKNANIDNGELYIEDRNMTPIYKIQITEIYIRNLNMDCGCPLSFLFNSEYGRCKLGDKGILLVEKTESDKGSINLTGATWADLAGLKVIPLPLLNEKIHLKANFTNYYKQDLVNIRGTLKNSMTSRESNDLEAQELLTQIESQDTREKASTFRLTIDWKEYALPFDLALKKLLLEIFHKLKIKGLVGFTIHTVTRGIVNIFTRV